MYKAFDLSGKVAVITGGNGGIGLGMAEALAMAGAALCIWGTSEAKNDAARARLSAHGGRVEALLCDIADRAAVEAAMAETVRRLGRVDACFANAGVRRRENKSVLALSEAEWRKTLAVNLDGAFWTLRAAAQHMIERAEKGDKGGRLVATSSLASLSGAARHEDYAATKGGVVAVVRAMAVELARHGVTANSILPGWIETEMAADEFANPKFHDNVMPRIPLRRWGKPADFGGIAVYLASDASAYHTGDSILIDGGYWIY